MSNTVRADLLEFSKQKKPESCAVLHTTLHSHSGLSMTHHSVLGVLLAFTLVLKERERHTHTHAETDSDQ